MALRQREPDDPAGMAVSGRKIGPVAGVPVPLVRGGVAVGGLAWIAGLAGGPAGGRMTKHAGPALRWLACDAVGLPVVFT